MQRYAIVKDGVVLNAVEYAEQPIGTPPAFEEGSVAIPELWATAGWIYTNGVFTDPNPPAPSILPNIQGA